MGFASAEPVTGKRALSIDMHLYLHQLEAAVSFAVEQEWDQVYHEALRNTLKWKDRSGLGSRPHPSVPTT